MKNIKKETMLRVLFRVDGNRKTGLGHITRCLTLAEALKKKRTDLEIVFITRYKKGGKIIKEKNYEVIPLIKNEICQIRNLVRKDTLLITDFLNTDNSYITKIKEKTGVKVISIDNNTKLKKINSDIVINANVFDGEERKVIGSTKYFLGPKYMILRKEFAKAEKERKDINEKVKLILVMFGATDPRGFTIKVADALKNIHNQVQTNLIMGPGFSYRNKLKKVLLRLNKNLKLFYNPKNFVEIIKNVDMAITAAGIALYEFAALGIPSIAIPQYKHQVDIARAFEKSRACINIGDNPSRKLIYKTTAMLIENQLLRKQLSKDAKKLVDGNGTKRVVKLILGN